MARRARRTVEQTSWEYIDFLRGKITPNSLGNYRTSQMTFNALYGAREIATLTEPDLFAYVYGRHAPASANVSTTRQTYVNGLMRYAASNGYARSMHIRSIVQSNRASDREWTRYTAEELHLLKNSTDCERTRIAISIASSTAMRVEDIIALRAPSASLTEKWLSTFIHKSGVYDFKVITDTLEVDLRRYFAWLRSVLGGPDELTALEYLIPGWPPNERGGAFRADAISLSLPISYYTLCQRFIKARDVAELPHLPRERWHSIRRSAGRLFFDAAASYGYDQALRMTQAFLNHKSSATTERYIGLSYEYEKRNDFLRSHDFLATGAPRNVVALGERRVR